ncbi:MAG: Tryptophan synthase alpha chain [Myxococcaceae bacterium]|nr:Tryptophan synthase alpha chain [Myxococcaceae bacterium]
MAGAIVIATIALAAACGDKSAAVDEDVPLPSRDAAPEATLTPCDGAMPDLTSDPASCGACGNVCAAGPRATASCVASKCVVACDTGFADCNGQAADGCETDLSNDAHACGACGRDCTACGGTTCAQGMCDVKTILTSTEPGITHVTVDATRIYFITGKNVQQVEKDGTKAAVVFSAVNSTGVGADTLVNVVVPGTTGGSGIYRTTAGFVGPQIPALAGGRNVVALTVDDTGVYYAAEKSAGISEIARCNNCSGNPTVLVPAANSVGVAGIALDGATVFIGAGDTIQRVEKTGADAKTLVVGQKPRSLSTDETHVYWINFTPGFGGLGGDAGPPTGEVARMLKTGGPVEKIATALRSPLFLAAATTGVYYSDRGLPNAKDGTIVRLSADGKTTLTLASGLDAASGIGVDDACVYFGDGATVKKVTR